MITKRATNIKRRNRPNGRKGNFPRNGFEGSPNSRPKGSVSKVLEKYLNLAQDAQSNGDRIKAEGFFQHAEHYQRLMNSNPVKSAGNNFDSKEINKPENNQLEGEANGKNKLFSRTERAEQAKTKKTFEENAKNPKKNESFTSDGVEALKAFSGSINKTE